MGAEWKPAFLDELLKARIVIVCLLVEAASQQILFHIMFALLGVGHIAETGIIFFSHKQETANAITISVKFARIRELLFVVF